MARNLLVKIEGDASSLSRAFADSTKDAKRFERDVGKIGRGAIGGSGLFRGLGRSVAFASTAFLGGFGLVAAVRASLEEMDALDQIANTTNAVLKSTGGVAGVTAEHVNELAESLSNLTGTSKSEIETAENLLLTFTNVRNVAGANNKIFDEATQAALDLAAAMHTDLRSATLLVGKALQNPVKGLQQLNRATGGLSESQAKLVKRLVASGNVLGAQKVILNDLRRSFKGAAEVDSLGFQIAVFRNNLVDLGAKIAENFRPQLEKTLRTLDDWITNVDNQNRVIGDAEQVIGALEHSFEVLHGVFNDLNKVTGGTKRSLELLLVAFLAFKGIKILATLTSVAADLGLIGTNAEAATADVAALKTELAFPSTLNTTVGTTAGEVAVVGTNAEKSAGKVAGLKGSLAGLGALGEIAVPVTIAILIKTAGPGLVDQILPKGKVRDTTKKVLFGSITDVVKEANRDLFNPLGRVKKIAEQDLGIVKELGRRVGLLDRARGIFDVGADVPRGKELKRLNEEAAAEPPGEPPGGLTKKQLAEAAARRRQAREAFRQQIQDEAQLRVDRATLTKGTSDDIAALKNLETLLKRRAAGEQKIIDSQKSSQAQRARAQQALIGNERDLIGVQKQLADLQEQAAQTKIDRLQFGVDVATATAGLRDDLGALARLRRFLEQRLSADKTNLDLQRQIFDVNQQIADVQKRRRDERQFRLLGLGPTGDDLVPGVRNLKNQLKSVRDAIEGTFLNTSKTRGLLGHIRQILSGGLGSVSADVRQKVAQILADLKDQLKQSSVDVTRFQDTARGQFTLAGAHPHGRLAVAGGGGGIVVNGGIHLHGVQNVKQLEDELARRAKQRARARRGNR